MSAADPRLPVVFGPAALAGAQDALLLDEGQPEAPGAGLVVRLPAAAPGRWHPVGCACCLPRDAAAQVLGRLFLARARGEVAPFARLVVAVRDEAAVRLALQSDRLVAGRYRLVDAGPPGDEAITDEPIT